MKSISGRDFARMVERRGWQLLRISGSHHIYGKPGSVVRLSIPIPEFLYDEVRAALTASKAVSVP